MLSRHQVVGGDEIADLVADHRRATHAATDIDLRAEFAVADVQPDADVVEAHSRAILVRRDHANLEFAREVREFRMEGRPLADQLGPGTRIGDLVRGGAGELIRTDVADAVAAGLDGVHLDRRQLLENVRGLVELDPVELDVLPRGEVPVAAIVLARDVAEHPHLAPVERTVRHCDAQHVRVQLEVQAVHQPQWLELVLGQLAREAAADLIAEFIDALVDDRLVVFVVFIHIRLPSCRRSGRRV
jgi:hypothetical protein